MQMEVPIPDCEGAVDAPRKQRGTRWVDPFACPSLVQLILNDRHLSPGVPPARRRPPLPPALYHSHVAPFLRFEVPLPDMLYAFGGRNRRRGPVNTAEMLDTWHGTWVALPEMPRRRAGSAAASLPDGRVIVVGGYDERGIVDGLLSSCDVYDPLEERWHRDGAAPLARARWGHGCAALAGRVYAVGGCALQVDTRGLPQEALMETQRSCEVYDPQTDSWSSCAPLQVPRSGSRVVTLGSGHIAAVGGCDDVFGRAETQATIEVYSLDLRAWSLLDTRLAIPRTSAAVAAIEGGRRFFVAGGAPSQASVEVFPVPWLSCGGGGAACGASPAASPVSTTAGSRTAASATSCWPSVAASSPVSSPSPRDDVDAAPEATEGDWRDLLQRIARQQASSKEVADMPEGRMGCQAAVVELPRRPAQGDQPPSGGRRSCVLVVGGELCDEAAAGGLAPLPRVRQLSSVAAYDLEAGAWCEAEAVPHMTTPRTTMALCLGHGRVAPARLRA